MPPTAALHALPSLPPRILVVSRRSIRKDKYIDFVGEYHLDLLLRNGACPVILPRLPPTSSMLSAYEPIHGVLLTEGEDIGPAFRHDTTPPDVAAAVRRAHPSDAAVDHEKDRIEVALADICLRRGIPLLGICRGSQIINLVAGGSLLHDIDVALPGACRHIDYANYDAHRHLVHVVSGTPLSAWFDAADSLVVNSYHHQGIERLARRFCPMAHAPDGLVEGFYDQWSHAPQEGRFLVGLQFHPERMQSMERALRGEEPVYDYPGCARPYEDFVLAARVYQSKQTANAQLNGSAVRPMKAVLVDMERKEDHRRGQENRFRGANLARCAECVAGLESKVEKSLDVAGHNFDLDVADENRSDKQQGAPLHPKGRAFLEATEALTAYSKEDLNRLMRSGATVHGARLVQQLLHNGIDLSDYRYAPNKRANMRPQ